MHGKRLLGKKAMEKFIHSLSSQDLRSYTIYSGHGALRDRHTPSR
ncbi:MAG: hypothetical protein AB1589_23975 [Cyanobacteriota bacterium]